LVVPPSLFFIQHSLTNSIVTRSVLQLIWIFLMDNTDVQLLESFKKGQKSIF
jgi:hypothetical protein